eukprot:m.65983 g.65983  ORF g.65983 m.65983 type:complete len:136 (-) comp12086_c0_seq3:1157-1564(-)
MINKGRTQGQKRGEGTHQTLCTVPFDNVILKPDQQLHLPAFKKSSNASFSLMLRRTPGTKARPSSSSSEDSGHPQAGPVLFMMRSNASRSSAAVASGPASSSLSLSDAGIGGPRLAPVEAEEGEEAGPPRVDSLQ